MKKILLLLFSILISFNSYGGDELDSSSDTFCDQSPKAQVRNGLYYLPNQQEPFTGENLCVYESNGQYHSKGNILNGLKDGKWTYWYENGQIFKEGNYKVDIDELKLDAITDQAWDYPYDNRDGKWTWWYTNGWIKQEWNFKDGKREGKSTYWNENGQKKSEFNYKDGEKDGKTTWWKRNGQIFGEAIYKDGKCISGDCPNAL